MPDSPWPRRASGPAAGMTRSPPSSWPSRGGSRGTPASSPYPDSSSPYPVSWPSTAPPPGTSDGTSSSSPKRVSASKASQAAAALLGPRLPAAFREAGLRGRAGLSGRYTLQQTNQESTDNLSASLSLEGVELDPVVGGRPLRVRADGRIDASGPTRDPSLSIDLRSTLGRIAASGAAVAGSTVRLVASGTKASAAISRFDARLTGLDIAVAGGKTLAFDHATIAAKGGLDLSRKSLSVASLEANLPGLAPLRLSGRYGFGQDGAADIRLESRGLDLPALRGLAAPFIPAGFAGWDLGGTADLSLSARRPAGSRAALGLSATVSLAGLRFNDPAFTVAGENLDPVVKLEALRSASGEISFTGGLAVGQGESLWKAAYIPWAKSPLDLAFNGRYDPRSGAVDGLTVRVHLPTIGTVDIAGSAGTVPALSFDLQTDANLSLGPLHALFSQAGVSEEGRMKLEGALGASLRLRTGRRRAFGRRPDQALRREHRAFPDEDLLPRHIRRHPRPLRVGESRRPRRRRRHRCPAPRGGLSPRRRVPEPAPDAEGDRHRPALRRQRPGLRAALARPLRRTSRARPDDLPLRSRFRDLPRPRVPGPARHRHRPLSHRVAPVQADGQDPGRFSAPRHRHRIDRGLRPG